MDIVKKMSLGEEISDVINRHSAENGCDTPDFILAEFLTDCLVAFDRAVKMREGWYGRKCGDGAALKDANVGRDVLGGS